jgi:3-oxoadipate enol-lactonase
MSKVKVGQALIHYQHAGDGEPLLLIQGLGGDLHNWKNALPRLQERHRVIAFDNRGVGLTEAPAGSFTMETMADDAAGLLHALAIPRAHVVGWSMGGNVAQELALRHPERVATLTLMSTYARAPARSRFALDAMIRGLREGASPGTAMMMMRAWCSTEAAFVDETVPRVPVVSKGPNGVEGFAHQKKALDGFDSRKRLKGLRVPTLVIHGSDDIMVPPDFASELVGRIAGARLHWIKGAGHFLPPKGWIEPTLEFLSKHPLSRS